MMWNVFEFKTINSCLQPSHLLAQEQFEIQLIDFNQLREGKCCSEGNWKKQTPLWSQKYQRSSEPQLHNSTHLEKCKQWGFYSSQRITFESTPARRIYSVGLFVPLPPRKTSASSAFVAFGSAAEPPVLHRSSHSVVSAFDASVWCPATGHEGRPTVYDSIWQVSLRNRFFYPQTS